MKVLKSKVSITLDEDIVDLVKELAIEDDRSFSQYVNIVLKDHLLERKDDYSISQNDGKVDSDNRKK